MTAVSIILPTYNRADTILRAVNSVVNQTFQDWELLIIDDGSTDNTVELISGIDPRIIILKQKNSGVYVARNTGLKASRGEYLTFLDSDDEWLPHFLELTTSFLRAHPDESFVSTEFYQDWGTTDRVRHDYQIIVHGHVKNARALRLDSLSLPAGETDDYLRIYTTKNSVGDWGKSITEHLGNKDAQLYQGHIFEHMRWGYLNWLPVILITRRAFQQVGEFQPAFRSGADFHFLAMLAHSFQANMIGVPGAFKHEKSDDSKTVKEEHLAAGVNSYQLAINHLHFFEELYWSKNPTDRELNLIRSLNHLQAGRSALFSGKRIEARQHLLTALKGNPRSWAAYPLLFLARACPSDVSAAKTYSLFQRILSFTKSFLQKF